MVAVAVEQEGFIVGLDVGYSNVCFAAGRENGPMVSDSMPAGAGPATLLPESIGRPGSTPGEGCMVEVDGELWVAGVEPARLQGWSRDLHHDYPSTKTYWALFLAALARIGARRIHRLVTGLPVDHYRDPERRDRLAERLRGRHPVRNGRGNAVEIVVDEVLVLPQPAGCFLDYLSTADNLGVAEQGRVLVVDPGFFSLDWVLVEGGELRTLSSGSSLHAVSAVLEAMDDHLWRTHGVRIGPERLERALRRGDATVLVAGREVPVRELAGTDAAQEVVRKGVVQMRQALRNEVASIDLILIAGGGAGIYQRAVTDAFPGVPVHTAPESHLANARGYWYAGL